MLLIMDRFKMMKAYVTVVEEGSFVAASKRLHTTPQLISKYVLALEKDLGVTLLNRTTRSINRTEVGDSFFKKCVTLIEDYEVLVADVRQENTEPRGHLRISVPVTFAEIFMGEVLADFAKLYPDISVNMRLTDRYVDLLEENIDVAIRLGQLESSTLVARKIANTRLCCCASHTYLETAGWPKTPGDLHGHDCIIDTNLEVPDRWSFMRNGQEEIVPVSGRLTVNSATTAIDLARRGSGIVKCPDLFVQKDLAAGKLVSVFDENVLTESGLFAVFHQARRPAAKIRVFIDFMVEAIRARGNS